MGGFRPRCLSGVLLLLLVPASGAAQQQDPVVERVAFDSPEGWAMAWVGASTLSTGFSPAGALAPGKWELVAELTAVPGLDADQQRVGFGGLKSEDLDKSPVFGRGIARLGLPGGWQLELGYTPPITVNGARPRDLLRMAVQFRQPIGRSATLAFGAHLQHGSARGDVTCPAEVARNRDPAINPYGCLSASDDIIDLGQRGLGVALDLGAPESPWHWRMSVSRVRHDPRVQVRAELEGGSDRTVLESRGWTTALGIGVGRALSRRSWFAAELVHVPLSVHRNPGVRSSDDFTSLRISLGWRP